MKNITIHLTDENHERLNQLSGFAGITVEELAAQVIGDYIADHAAAAADSAKNVVLATFGDYNERRFSAPWCCTMTAEGWHGLRLRAKGQPQHKEPHPFFQVGRHPVCALRQAWPGKGG